MTLYDTQCIQLSKSDQICVIVGKKSCRVVKWTPKLWKLIINVVKCMSNIGGATLVDKFRCDCENL